MFKTFSKKLSVTTPATSGTAERRRTPERRQPDTDTTRAKGGGSADDASVNTTGTSGTANHSIAGRFQQDEPEVDYDIGPTELYRLIEHKKWDAAVARSEIEPREARTWVSRREHGDANKIRWRLLPLHATCVFRSPLGLIEALIKAYPDGPQMKDDQGMLPLHLACRNGASKGVVVTLLNAFPESLRVRDRKGRVPMNLVENSKSQNREAVLLSMRKFEAGLNDKSLPPSGMRSMTPRPDMAPNEVDYEHRTVLFRLILKKDWTASVARSNAYPEESATWIVTKGFNGNLRFLPLHKACVLQPHEDVVEALVASYPEGAKSRDQDGWLPLHCACFYGASESVVSTLLVANPKGAHVKDDEGRLPLHYACLKGASDGVVSALVQSFPKGPMSKDDEGRLPLHHACSKGAPDGVVETLVKSSPKSAQSKDDQGRLPLHHACRKNATERTVQALLRVYPRGAQVKDDQDKLPVHYACQNGASEGVINLLLSTFPESINVKNGFGYTPLAEAKAMNNPKMDGVIAVLEKFKSKQDQIRGNTHGGDGGGGSGLSEADAAALHAKVFALTERVAHLESVLTDVARIGGELRNGLEKKKDLTKAIRSFADSLASVEAVGGEEEDEDRGQ